MILYTKFQHSFKKHLSERDFCWIVIYIVLLGTVYVMREEISEFYGSVFGNRLWMFFKNKTYTHQERLVYKISQLRIMFCSLNGL